MKNVKVITLQSESELLTLGEAMEYAKTFNEFVTIRSPDFELVGRFGVDSIENGLCPDGIKYDWDKSTRAGTVRNK